MAKYRQYFSTTAYTYAEVEADNADEAFEKLEAHNDFPTLCYQCSGGWEHQERPPLELNESWEADGDVELAPE